MTVKGGTTLVVSNSNALGTGSDVDVEAGGGIEMTGGITIANKVLSAVGTSSNASPTNVTASLASVSGVNEWSGDIDADTTTNVRFSVATGATLRLSGDIVLSGTGSMVLTGNSNGTGVISGDISGDVGAVGSVSGVYAIIQNGGGNWTLSGNNTFQDSVRIDNGSVSVASIATNLGQSTFAIGLGETAGTGRLIYTGSGETTERGFILRSTEATGAGGGAIEQAGTGLLKINGSITSSATTSSKTFTLTGSTVGSGEIAGAISNGTGSATNVTKTGTGAWTLSNATNSYTGSTTVTNGTLTVTGKINSTTSLSVTNGTFSIGANDAVSDAATVGLGANSVLQIAGFTESLGAMTVTGNSIINLLGDGNLLTIASGNITGGNLGISGWNGNATGGGTEQLVFASNTTIASQLSSVYFVNPEGFAAGTYSAKFIGTELVPDALIPEPSTLALAMMSSAGLMIRRRRR